MRLAIVVLLIVAGMHYLPDPIASAYANKLAAAKAWEYILGGLGSATLCLLVGLLARNPLAWPALIWGMVEGGERAVCRLARPIGVSPPETSLFTGLCGTEFYWLGVGAALVLAVAVLDRLRVQQ